MHKKIIALILTAIFAFQVPASAGAFSYNFNGYTPPTSALTSDVEIIEDANHFIEVYYDQLNYFVPTIGIYDNKGNRTSTSLRVQQDYNISDDREIGGQVAPILYYEKAGGGPGRSQQYLGQTKQGFTITNVRFPLNASWSFLEDLNWAPAGDPDAFKWWRGQGNDIGGPEELFFNTKANNDSNYAAMLDFSIGAGTIGQLRNWGGQQYYISKAQAGVDGKPGKFGGAVAFTPDATTNFQWHKYVNVLMPPTWNTYGYGIGFYRHGNSYSYKSFPILPLQYAHTPDFYPTADQTTYTGEPGETVTVKVKLNNKGERDITNFAWTEYGGGWGNPKWLDTDVELGKGASKDYEVQFVVTDQPQKYVFAANVHGDKPGYEYDKTNNSLIITVMPDSVDLAASIVPVQKQYTARHFPYMTACNVSAFRKDNGGQEVPAIINVSLSDGQKRVFEHTFKAGSKWGDVAIWSVKKAGTYTARVEVQPIGFKDANPADNVATCTFTVVQQKITPPSNNGDEDITSGIGSM